MFDSLKNLSQLGPMMRKMQDMQAKLPLLRASATAGGNLVTATASGTMEIVSLVYSTEAMKTDPELLADLTRTAVNQALRKVQEAVQQEMQQASGGVDMDAFRNMLGQ